ncbi:MAG TPA: 4-hydroxyphenylpyruvate dioxygenase, partial [Xanthomonadaceae bacterium]|nr:4-hydroxyphenylpyruvate dioxygenase [Xanthomonadaceae bacterium]
MSAQPTAAGPNLGIEVTTFENPMGINGFEFVEFAAPAGQGHAMRDYLERLGFTAIARHRDRAITLFRQGTINFLLNEEPGSFAAGFAAQHGPSACGFAIRFKRPTGEVLDHVLANGGAKADDKPETGAIDAPAIKGIGDCMLYLVDDGNPDVYADYVPLPGVDQHPKGFGLTFIDHLTHN